MLKNRKKVYEFYKKLIQEDKISYKKSLMLYEFLYKEAVSLGVVHSRNILEGLEVDIKIAKAINGLI